MEWMELRSLWELRIIYAFKGEYIIILRRIISWYSEHTIDLITANQSWSCVIAERERLIVIQFDKFENNNCTENFINFSVLTRMKYYWTFQ